MSECPRLGRCTYKVTKSMYLTSCVGEDFVKCALYRKYVSAIEKTPAEWRKEIL